MRRRGSGPFPAAGERNRRGVVGRPPVRGTGRAKLHAAMRPVLPAAIGPAARAGARTRRPGKEPFMPRAASRLLLRLAATLALALPAGAPAWAAVTVTIGRPLDGDILASPVGITAQATTDAAGAEVTGWHVYVDGVSAYGTAGPAAAINPHVALANGPHEVVVFAWDSTGDNASATVNVTVGTCSGFTVSLDAPAGGTETAPVHFSASAASCHRITGLAVYADGVRLFAQSGPRSLDTDVDLPAGSHTVMARAWDSTGATASSGNVALEVEAPAPAAPARPAPSPAPGQRKPPAAPPPPASPAPGGRTLP